MVLVGDPYQLPEIDAGGVLAGLAQRVEPLGLSQNRRQHDAWEREALRALRVGQVDVALDAYDAHDRVVTAPTADGTREIMVADWWAASRRAEQVLMVAARHADVDDLNARARAHVDAAGQLTGPTLELDGRPYQTGDRVMTLRNQRRLGVRNGTFATITDVDVEGRALTIRTDHATTHLLPAEYLDAGHVRHTYTTTIHKAQGITVDQTFVLGNHTLYQQAGYVALSRGRANNRIYLVEQPEREHEHHTPEPIPDPRQTLADALQVSRAQELGLDRGIDHDALGRKRLDEDLHRLCDERARLEWVRAARPHDPAADISSLEIGRDQLTYALGCQQRRLGALTDPYLIRHRAERTAERHAVGEAVENLQRQLERTRHALELAYRQQAVHNTFADTHSKELAALSSIGYVIDARVTQLVASYRHEPPAYLARRLGPYPDDHHQRSTWDDAAQMVEHYRHTRHITDQHDPLGVARERDREQRHARDQLQRAVRTLTLGVGRSSPELEIGL